MIYVGENTNYGVESSGRDALGKPQYTYESYHFVRHTTFFYCGFPTILNYKNFLKI